MTAKIQPDMKAEAWRILYSIFGERMQQEELDLMDSVLKSVELDVEEGEEEMVLTPNEILRQFPHLASKEADNKEIPEWH